MEFSLLLIYQILYIDESSGLEWNIRCEIIRGICDGLHYLHGECQIIHLDLKPENILLGTNMEPKIADFGLSKIDRTSNK